MSGEANKNKNRVNKPKPGTRWPTVWEPVEPKTDTMSFMLLFLRLGGGLGRSRK